MKSVKMEMNGLALWMENITIPSVTVLSLFLETNGHNFEGRVLQLLLNCVVIRELHLSFQSRDEVQGYCSDDCICHSEPVIWGAKIIPVRGLRKITIYNFNGAPREVNFLDELVRRALGLDTLRIISNVDDPCLEGIEEISPAGCKIYVQWAASATRSSSC